MLNNVLQINKYFYLFICNTFDCLQIILTKFKIMQKIIKRESQKYPYGSRDLSNIEAKKNFTNFWNNYGLLTMSLLFVMLCSSPAYCVDPSPIHGNTPGTNPNGPASVPKNPPAPGSSPGSAPTGNCVPASNPNSPNFKPAVKELVSATGVALVCIEATTTPVSTFGVIACVVTVLAKAFDKL